MPEFAIYNGQLITSDDIYKYGIDKDSDFKCFVCDKSVHFRQSRNADKHYTDHFYHQNTTKNTHIECEKVTLDKVIDITTWHNRLSNFIHPGAREVIRKRDDIKHIVDVFDASDKTGVEFQNSPISIDAIKSRDETTFVDWVFNVEAQYIRKIEIGDKIACEIPHDNWENAVKVVKNNVYLYTGSNEWILLEDRESYRIEIEGKLRNVWLGSPCSFEEVYETTCLHNTLTKEGKDYFESLPCNIVNVRNIFARCKKSMFLLDDIHRKYIDTHQFTKNDIVAIKSVAGSGKTTTLLNLTKIHGNKRILYLAFNRALIEEITMKIRKLAIKNLYPFTFDKLMVSCYKAIKKSDPNITPLNPRSVEEVIPWLSGKPFPVRKSCVDSFAKFCQQTEYLDPSSYFERIDGKTKPLVDELWKKALKDQLVTFETLRKMSLVQHWLKVVDTQYDMIMIDETQDFDIMMLTMLLEDTTIPKIFVGDSMQSIYQWRGCINGFDFMPKSALTIEFYSTFRIGDPACEEIRGKFDNCWMISKSKNTTLLSNVMTEESYIYLFRSWRHLLTTAKTMKNIWICNFDTKVDQIRQQHERIQKKRFDDDKYEDDLPVFLKTLSVEGLNELLDAIYDNIVDKARSKVKLYTIHSYKGLESDYIRIAKDVTDADNNLKYVALTRGMKCICVDPVHV
jgi:AAA domain